MEIQSSCIHHLFEQQVSRQPDSVAVIDQHQRITYQELNQRANQLAYDLKSLGVKQEVLVGICLERSLEMVVSLLAILKAGGAYVPLDPSYPQERLDFTIHDAEIFCLITQESLQSLFPNFSAPVIYIDKLCIDLQNKDLQNKAIAQYPDENLLSNLPSTVASQNLAYIIYTSGSTGKPKGVAIEHRNTVALINWAQNFFTESMLAGVLASTSICFDLSVFELFVTLSCGGKVILADNALQLPSLPARNEVTLINTVPSAIATLLKIKGIPNSVHTINLAGEALSAKIVQSLYHLDHIKQVFNLYGPSEDTTYSTVAFIPRDFTGIPPIGKAIAQSQLYLLNDSLQQVSLGTEGEIYMGGAGLARGYLHRPELTEASFIPNPFQDEFGARLYKTGDLGFLLPDGNCQYLGRIDNLVKLHGFRIELGEIETILEQNLIVSQAVVAVQPFSTEEQRLVAYIIPNPSVDNSFDRFSERFLPDLKSTLQQKLPPYMMPSQYVLLEKFPLTLNGKVDRKSLPQPNWQRSESAPYMPPSTPLELKLAEIWQYYLKVEKISLDDSFFDLGGDSLLVIQMLYRIQKVIDIDISFEHFLTVPTLKNLTTAIVSSKLPSNQSQPCIVPPTLPNFDSAIDAVLASDIYPSSSQSESVNVILLTGSTGILGVFLLHELLQKTSAQIYCLVRSDNVTNGFSRIEAHLHQHQLWQEAWKSRLVPIIGDLSKPRLGLTSEEFINLARQVDRIYHCGAWVNVVYPYSLLRTANVKSTEEILRLACLYKTKSVHYISTVDVFSSTGVRQVREQDGIGKVSNLCSGYAESKAIAEKLVMEAHNRGVPVSIYRPSNIIGTTQCGITSNGFIGKMLKSCLQMGTVPNLEASVNLVTVDYVSKAIIGLSQQAQNGGKAFHIINPQPISWRSLAHWLNHEGYPIKIISHESWYRQLDQLITENIDISLSPLIYSLADPNFIQRSLGAFHFKAEQTLIDLAQLGIDCPSVNQLLYSKLRLSDLACVNNQ